VALDKEISLIVVGFKLLFRVFT
jgi:hypothetical protein